MEEMDRPSLRLLIGKENLVGVEIGVYQGRNAKEILDNLDIKKIYLIDNWKRGGKNSKDKCKELLKDYSHKIVWLKGLSQNMVKHIKEKLDFVYVDGGHTEPQVTLDLEKYYPRVKKGGLICGHDYQGGKPKGVNEAVNRFFKEKGLEIHSGICGPIKKKRNHYDWWVWK